MSSAAVRNGIAVDASKATTGEALDNITENDSKFHPRKYTFDGDGFVRNFFGPRVDASEPLSELESLGRVR